jgi:hypothetical protein
VQGEDCALRTQYVVVVEGETVIDEPVPEITFDPIVDPVPHWYTLPDPPLAVKVTEVPEQIVVKVAFMLVGAVAADDTFTVNVTPVVFEQGEFCVLRTQYVVVEPGVRVIEEPV